MAEKNLLTIVQDFCKRAGIPVPPVAAGSTDDTTVQVVALLNEGIQDLCDRYSLQQLMTSCTFQHANGTDYLAFDLAALPDWKYNEPLTIWDTETRLPLRGVATVQEWQQIITMQVAPAYEDDALPLIAKKVNDADCAGSVHLHSVRECDSHLSCAQRTRRRALFLLLPVQERLH